MSATETQTLPAPPPVAPDPARERERLLGPFVELVRRVAESGADSSSASSQAARLEAWERRALIEGLPWSRLVAEGAALRVRGRTERTRVERSEDRAAAIDEAYLMTLAVGMALLDDLQQVMDAMVGVGDLVGARKLASFRTTVGKEVARLKELAGPEVEVAARQRVPPLRWAVDPGVVASTDAAAPETPPATTDDASTGDEAADELLRRVAEASPEFGPLRHQPKDGPAPVPAPARKTSSAAAREPMRAARGARSVSWPSLPSLPALLGIVLLLAAAGVSLWFWLGREPELPPLTPLDFAAVEEVRQVMARPPNVYLTLHHASWRGLSAEARLALIESIAARADAAGYTGAHVMTDAGRLVGQWRRGTAPRLL